MSIVFYDRLIIFEGLDKEIKKLISSKEEEEELWQLVDEISQHRVLGLLLNKLPSEEHVDFMDRFQKAPYDESLFDYLKEKIGENIEELIRQEIGDLSFELLESLKFQKVKQKKASSHNK